MTTTPQSSFTIRRMLPGSPRHAWRFWADPALKQRWTDCHPDWTVLERNSDFAIGGVECQLLRGPDGREQRVDTHYLDLQPNRRIVYAYSMHLDDAPLSASLVTIDFLARADGTELLFVEHLALLDGSTDAALRQSGTNEAIDRIAALFTAEMAGATSH